MNSRLKRGPSTMQHIGQVFFYSVMLCACATHSPPQAQATPDAQRPVVAVTGEPFASTYHAISAPPVLIHRATLLTGTGERIDEGDVLIADGRIVAVGRNLSAPTGAKVIEAQGRWVTPGLIDVHSHLGVYASPGVDASSDGNESSGPITPDVWAEHGVWPQDPGVQAALEGGVTTLEILPGSANLIGGRGVTLRNVAATSYQAMRFPGRRAGLKMACGENPKRVYGEKNQAPVTRMGNVAGYRQAFADAQEYQRSWREYRRKLAAYEKKKATDKDAEPPAEPKRDLKMETLVEVLEGRVRVQMHCYRADEMMTMLDVAKEFGFHISAFHHGVEAYKIADQLAAQGVCGALWADWWGFKMEALDGIQENLALVDRPAGQLRHRAFGFGRGHPATEPGGGEGHGARRAGGIEIAAGAGDPLAHRQSGQGAGHPDRVGTLESRQDGRRRRLEPRSVQCVRARRAGVHRRRYASSTARIPQPNRARTFCSVSLARRVHDESFSPFAALDRSVGFLAVLSGTDRSLAAGSSDSRREGPYRGRAGHARESRRAVARGQDRCGRRCARCAVGRDGDRSQRALADAGHVCRAFRPSGSKRSRASRARVHSGLEIGAPNWQLQWRPGVRCRLPPSIRAPMLVARSAHRRAHLDDARSAQPTCCSQGRASRSRSTGATMPTLAGSRSCSSIWRSAGSPLRGAAAPREYMLLEQAIREARTPARPDRTHCCILRAAKRSRNI